MRLDARLRSVVSEVQDSKTTIDVGTDHGKVILTCLIEGRCKKGIASDISRDSLDKARRLAKNMDIDLDTRLGDGLSVISDGEVDTAVIAGMGGQEIVKILDTSPCKVPRLVLVPHRDTYLVRHYLADNGYEIVKDYMVKEGTFYYNIIVARVGKMTLSERGAYLGKNTLDDEVFREYVVYRKRVLSEILGKTDNDLMRREYDLLDQIQAEYRSK